MSAVQKPDNGGEYVPKTERGSKIALAVAAAQEAAKRARTSPPPPPPPSDREKLIHNEQTKLTATLLNGIALAFIVGGALTTLNGFGGLSNASDQILRAAVWIPTGIALHIYARSSLGNLL